MASCVVLACFIFLFQHPLKGKHSQTSVHMGISWIGFVLAAVAAFSAPPNQFSSTKRSTASFLSMSVANSGRRLVGKLKPETSMFLLCDIQERFRPLMWRGETVINTSRYLTSVAKALDIPVVITQQYTKVFGKTVEDCFADPEDLKNTPMYEKKNFSMCTQEGMEVEEYLKMHVLSLFSYSYCVLVSASRRSHEKVSD
eukprot:scaffold10199_cov146-Cylindrotheca_fusiformis.AAC.27